MRPRWVSPSHLAAHLASRCGPGFVAPDWPAALRRVDELPAVTLVRVLTAVRNPGTDRWQLVIALRPSAGLLLRVSWLLAACIPGLLMLSTFGLERLETGLHRGPGAAQEATTFLEQAVRAAREEAQLRAAETAPKRPDTHFGLLTEEPGLPTRMYAHANPNPQFPRTRYANRV